MPTASRAAGPGMPPRALRGEAFDVTEIVVRPVSGNPPVHLMISGRPLRMPRAPSAVRRWSITTPPPARNRAQAAAIAKLDAIGKPPAASRTTSAFFDGITGTTETLVAGLAHEPALQKTAELDRPAAERCSELIQHLLALPAASRCSRAMSTSTPPCSTSQNFSADARRADRVNSIPRAGGSAHIDASQLANPCSTWRSMPATRAERRQALETRNVVLTSLCAKSRREARPLCDARGQRHRRRDGKGRWTRC